MASHRGSLSRRSRHPLRAAALVAAAVAVTAAAAAAAVTAAAITAAAAATVPSAATATTPTATTAVAARPVAATAARPAIWVPRPRRRGRGAALAARAPASASTCRCKAVPHSVCAAPLADRPGSCTSTLCEALVCDAAGTATCVRRVRMAYFLIHPTGTAVAAAPAATVGGGGGGGWGGGGSGGYGGYDGGGSSGGGGGAATERVWSCARMPVAVLEPAWACGSDPPLTCALRSDAAAAAVSGWVSFTTAPDCRVRVDGAVRGLRPGAAYTLTMTSSGQLSAGGGSHNGRDGDGRAHPSDAYDPLGEGGRVGWTLEIGRAHV